MSAANRGFGEIEPSRGTFAAVRDASSSATWRWVARLTGAANIRETTPFPRDLNRLEP